MPTDFAGPTDEAIWLIDLPSIVAYEEYRRKLAVRVLLVADRGF
jgi:hypothetical protein